MIEITSDKKFLTRTTPNGYKIYSIKNNMKLISEEEELGPLDKFETCCTSNIVAFLPSNGNTNFTQRKIIIWDCSNKIKINEIEFNHKIRSFKFYKDIFFIVCTTYNVNIFKLFDFENINSFITFKNKRGIYEFSGSLDNYICCYPSDSETPGYVTVFYSEKKITCTNQVHRSPIHHLVLNEKANGLITCSGKGTVIRYFSINKKGIFLIKEMRRGYEYAEIFSISISPNSEWINVTSDRGTGHIFNISQQKNENKNQKSLLSYGGFLNSIVPEYVSEYISSEWSSHQYVVDKIMNVSYINDENTVLVINNLGTYYYFKFNPNLSNQIKLIEMKNIF